MKEEATNSNSKPKSHSAIWIILSILGVIAVIILIAVINKGSINANVVNEGNQGSQLQSAQQNCRDVQVAYQDTEQYLKTEYYTETVPYQEAIPLVYTDRITLVSDALSDCSDLGNYKKCYYIEIKNLDSTNGGIFTANCKFTTLYRTLYNSVSSYVKVGEAVRFKCVADVDMGENTEMAYTVTPPTKAITSYRDVQRERQVTDYRPVTKYRSEQQCN